MKLALVAFATLVGWANALYPVVMIPGDGGSRLQARINKTWVPHYFCLKKSDWFDLWLDTDDLLPEVIDCWADNMRLKYDNKTRKTRDNDGVQVRVPGWGDPAYVEYLDSSKSSTGSYFATIANKLVKSGYERKKNLFGAPYDFRKAANEFDEVFKNLTALVETAYKTNGNNRVILLTHSMGSTTALYFLNKKVTQAWKDKYIRAMVTLAGPWAGTVRSMKVFAQGDNLGSIWVNSYSLRFQERSNPSLFWLMPSALLWPPQNNTLATSKNLNVTTANLRDFFYAFARPDGNDMYEDTKDLTAKLEAPNVDVYCLHGKGIDTTDKLVYKGNIKPDATAQLQRGDGDGTVNLRSLAACTKWEQEMAGKHKFFHHTFNATDHLGILTKDAPAEYVKNVIMKLNAELVRAEPVISLLP